MSVVMDQVYVIWIKTLTHSLKQFLLLDNFTKQYLSAILNCWNYVSKVVRNFLYKADRIMWLINVSAAFAILRIHISRWIVFPGNLFSAPQLFLLSRIIIRSDATDVAPRHVFPPSKYDLSSMETLIRCIRPKAL